MGLESHVTNALAREKSGFVEGSDYWFSNGLTTEREQAAHEIAIILDESGEFGPMKVKRVKTPDYVTSAEYHWKIEFDTHPSWLNRKTGDDMKPIPVYPNEWGVK